LSFHSESLNEVLQRKSCDVFGRRKTTAAWALTKLILLQLHLRQEGIW
jgi:hypothetical protein